MELLFESRQVEHQNNECHNIVDLVWWHAFSRLQIGYYLTEFLESFSEFLTMDLRLMIVHEVPEALIEPEVIWNWVFLEEFSKVVLF